MDKDDLYTPLADPQLDELAGTAPEALYKAVLDALDHVLDATEQARLQAPPLQDAEGRAVLSTVVRYDKDPRWFDFWRIGAEGPVILGIGPLPRL